MAAVTVNSKKFNVAGSMRENFYNITGVTGDTLDVGLYNVRAVIMEPGALTSYTLTADTPAKGQTRITFTSSGAYTAADLVVKGN